MEKRFPLTKEIYRTTWDVTRHGVVDEIVESDGSLTWRVEVWDGERDPFLTKYFNTKEAAAHFLERVKKGKA
jgi:hypothetical protein